MNSASFASWKDRVLFWSITAFIMGGVSWAGWLTIDSGDHVTRQDVIELIDSHAPYTQDKNMILERLKTMSETEKQLADVIQKNTDAINALRVELARVK